VICKEGKTSQDPPQVKRSPTSQSGDASSSFEISRGATPIAASLEEIQRRSLNRLRHIVAADHRCPTESFASYPAKVCLGLRHEFS